MSVRMRHTRAHTGNRRSHHAITGPRTSACANCDKEHLRHHVCPHCGVYRSRVVINVSAKAQKLEEKRKARAKEMGASGKSSKEEEKPLAPEELSEKK